MAETRLGRDVFIALAAVGWADGKLDVDEADAICRAALEEGLELDEIEEIEKATKSPVDIGSIDISGMSKADRLFVYAVGSWISRIDGKVAPEEQEALDRLGAALKIPERPREHAETIAAEIGALGESDDAAFFNLPKLRATLKVRLAEAARLRAQQDAEQARGESDDDPEDE
jgi:uncharacterized membrane protein YebE (DUF533 family)